MIKLLKDACPYCNKKTLGQENSFISCVNCDYDNDRNNKLSNEERHNKGMAIYDALVCNASNKTVRFTCVCNKLKGHKGEHKDNEHPIYTWINSKCNK